MKMHRFPFIFDTGYSRAGLTTFARKAEVEPDSTFWSLRDLTAHSRSLLCQLHETPTITKLPHSPADFENST